MRCCLLCIATTTVVFEYCNTVHSNIPVPVYAARTNSGRLTELSTGTDLGTVYYYRLTANVLRLTLHDCADVAVGSPS